MLPGGAGFCTGADIYCPELLRTAVSLLLYQFAKHQHRLLQLVGLLAIGFSTLPLLSGSSSFIHCHQNFWFLTLKCWKIKPHPAYSHSFPRAWKRLRAAHWWGLSSTSMLFFPSYWPESTGAPLFSRAAWGSAEGQRGTGQPWASRRWEHHLGSVPLQAVKAMEEKQTARSDLHWWKSDSSSKVRNFAWVHTSIVSGLLSPALSDE